MKTIVLEYKEHLKKYAAKNVKDYPLMRQWHKELYGTNWPYFEQWEYDRLLTIASKDGYCLEVTPCLQNYHATETETRLCV
jgi:hypothetical protein